MREEARAVATSSADPAAHLTAIRQGAIKMGSAQQLKTKPPPLKKKKQGASSPAQGKSAGRGSGADRGPARMPLDLTNASALVASMGSGGVADVQLQ
eukprot:COSAG02_NODE_52659_length_306_cov_1.000000_1_plen_96_part_01